LAYFSNNCLESRKLSLHGGSPPFYLKFHFLE
jgi:hypothetical protein